MMRWLLLIACSSLSIAQAAEIVPLRVQPANTMGVGVKALALPDTLRKDLSSGLTNRLVLSIKLKVAQLTVSEKLVEVAIKFDLWDERFVVTIDDGVNASTISYARVDDVMAALSELRLLDLFELQPLRMNQLHTLHVDALLNPIDKERLDKIRKWVADNSAYTPSGRSSSGTTTAASAGTNAVFNRIFEQYSSSADMAAVWREVAVSPPFTPENLPR
ncbi:MAG TPA: hypothetical protein VK629_20545 [Steroidobacteraceae bacterium]|nr:hypothetical protein [Steroidobacteraceae bacterium]